MTRAILTFNAGSSSLKVSLFPEAGRQPLATGLADRIGPRRFRESETQTALTF